MIQPVRRVRTVEWKCDGVAGESSERRSRIAECGEIYKEVARDDRARARRGSRRVVEWSIKVLERRRTGRRERIETQSSICWPLNSSQPGPGLPIIYSLHDDSFNTTSEDVGRRKKLARPPDTELAIRTFFRFQAEMGTSHGAAITKKAKCFGQHPLEGSNL